ncbi:MAG TPA: galactose oxidase-like domain-containing protein, partial [Polyangia bacterium]
HLSLLASSGKILATGFGRRASADCSGTTQREVGETWLVDPVSLDLPPAGNNLLLTPLNEQNLDPVHEVLYCAGHNMLPDGRLFYSGGTRYPATLPNSSPELGLAYSRIFDPATSTFTRIAANMKGGQAATPGMKWYPTNLSMPDGRVLMFGGFHWLSGGTGSDKNLSFELFDPKVWDANPSADPYTVLTQHAEGHAETPPSRGYTNLMLLPKPVPALNGGGLARSVAASGGAGRVFLFNHEPGPSGTQRLFARANSLIPNPSPTEKGEGASGLVLPDGRLMFTNGGHDGLGAARAYFYDPYADTWSVLDLGVSRLYGNATFLADGTVLLLNGYTSEPGNINDVTNPIGAQPPRQAQIINPYNNPPTVTTLPAWPEPTGRGYHSVSLLLKDGRVLVGGGKDNPHATGCEKNELRIFEPPYISNGPRPSIQMAAGQTMTVGGAPMNIPFTGTVRATRGVALLRPGAITHSFDQGQRYVPLTYASAGAGVLSVTPPPDLNVAPPGDYLLYFISDVGTPSMGLPVKVAAPPACVYAVDGNANSYIEAESPSRKAGPFVRTTDAAASGGAYQTVSEGSGTFFNVPDEARVMWFDIQVTNGGTFTPWFRMRGDDEGSDTFWVSLDGGPDVKLSAVLGGGFTWVKHTSTLTIPDGFHTLKIKVREDGARLDKIFLTKNATLTPTGIANTTLACNGPPAGPDNIPPPAPTGLTATAGSGQVALAWMAASGASSYTVKMGTTNGGPYTTFTQAGIAGTSYTKTGLTNGTTVYFVVTATNAFGEGPASAQVAATPNALAPISNMVVYDNLPAGCVTPNCHKDKWSVQTNFQVGNNAFGDRTYTIDAV